MRVPGCIESVSRRRFILAAGSGLLMPACALSPTRDPREILDDPFQLGVASGDPREDGMVLWTRLAPAPIDDESGTGGMLPASFEVTWQVAHDEQMRNVVQRGVEVAAPEWGHSLHVEIRGLRPDRPYWYAFSLGKWRSPVGKTRTLPPRGSNNFSIKFAFASCQNYEFGHYAAYRHMAADEPDLVLHLGDYIYEGSSGNPVRRQESASEPRSLDAYRRRHACYRLDPELQAAHAVAPWICIWDEHEVDNDYAALNSAEWWSWGSAFMRRRAAAYQAYWEHMPLPPSARPVQGRLPLYQRTQWGNLLRIHLLDTRQYRDDQPCQTFFRRGGRVAEYRESALDPKRSLLGARQEQWFASGLTSGAARWNLIAQPMLMAPLDQKPGAGEAIWTDGWDAYPAARDRLLGAIRDRAADNPVVIGGVIHSFWASSLRSDPDSPPLASHFVGTSISSPGLSEAHVESLRRENPHIDFSEARYRGYVLGQLDDRQLDVRFRAVKNVEHADSDAFELARFILEAGTHAPVKV